MTFYSFRGGVGRSMAMLNVGCLLARSARRVLLVDFDLEAPGLTRLIERGGLRKRGSRPLAPKGTVDILHDYLSSPSKSLLNTKFPRRSLGPFLAELGVPKTDNKFARGGSLHLMPAGRKRGYEKRLGELYMSSRKFKEVRKAFGAQFRKVLLDCGRFDYIFVDARTGFSDEGYIAAKLLCDHLVVLSGLNDQNIKGTADFLKKVAAWKRQQHAPDRIILVASPICEYEDDRKKQRFAEARTILKEATGADIDFTLSLPYHPRLALYEERVALQWPESGLGRAYRHLARVLRQTNADAASDWARRAREALDRGEFDACADAIEAIAGLDLDQAVNLARQTSSALAAVAGKRAKQVMGIFDRLARIDPTEPLHALQAARTARRAGLGKTRVLQYLDRAAKLARTSKNWGALVAVLAERSDTLIEHDLVKARDTALESLDVFKTLDDEAQTTQLLLLASYSETRLGDFASARAHAGRALSIARKLSRKRDISRAYRGMARLDNLEGNHSDARRRYEEALRIDREHGDRRGAGISVCALAGLDVDRGDFAQARQRYQAALKTARDLGDRTLIGAFLHNIGNLDVVEGKYVDARKRYEESLKTDRQLGDRAGSAITLSCIAELDLRQGKRSMAGKRYDEALKIKREVGARIGIADTLHGLGELERSTGNYESACRNFDEALSICRETGYAGVVALLKAHREAARAQGNTKLPLTKLRSAVDRARRDPDPFVTGRVLLLLGEVERGRGEFEKALGDLDGALATSRGCGMRGLVAFVQAERAICLSAIGRDEKAVEAAREAIAFFKEQRVRHPEATVLRKLAVVTRKQTKRRKG